MSADEVAFLRGVSNVPMQPLRESFERIGLTHVRTFGASGNILFCSDERDFSALETRIAEAVGAEAFVRSRDGLAAIAAQDPFAGRPGAAVFLAKNAIDTSRAGSLLAVAFEGETPVVSGSTVYFVHPTRRPGYKGIVDFERELGIRGTMRSSKVIARVLDMMM